MLTLALELSVDPSDSRAALSSLGRGGVAVGESLGLIEGDGIGDPTEFVREGEGRRANENLGRTMPVLSAGDELGEVVADTAEGIFTSTNESTISSFEASSPPDWSRCVDGIGGVGSFDFDLCFFPLPFRIPTLIRRRSFIQLSSSLSRCGPSSTRTSSRQLTCSSTAVSGFRSSPS